MADRIDNVPQASRNERRRSSAGERYANLMALKRDPNNKESMARRQSLTDQKPKVGIIGQMWNNYVRHNDSTGK